MQSDIERKSVSLEFCIQLRKQIENRKIIIHRPRPMQIKKVARPDYKEFCWYCKAHPHNGAEDHLCVYCSAQKHRVQQARESYHQREYGNFLQEVIEE